MLYKYKYYSIMIICGMLMSVSAEAKDIEVRDLKDLENYFNSRGYTPESWKNGDRAVPRFTFNDISENWRKRTVKEIDVVTKKRIFFRVLAPLGLIANEEVMIERERLLKILGSSNLNSEDRDWLSLKMVDYRVVKKLAPEYTKEQLEELKVRIDIVPLSLILAQSAEESGWGTSRFTSEGNSLFGQWSWGKNAMIPKQQRKELGNYGLAAFDTPLEAVQSYIHNLNSGTAYDELRAIRASQREKGGILRGKPLTDGLIRYSERGEEYVKGIKAIMRVNKLADADHAYLSEVEEDQLVGLNPD